MSPGEKALDFTGGHFDAFITGINVVESIVTIAAIIAGLWWFLRKREKAPRANVTHNVKFVDLKTGIIYVGITIQIKNTGNVVIKPEVKRSNTSSVIIEELSPYLRAVQESQESSPEYQMHYLGGRTFPANIHIEPGETQPILFEFIIQRTTKAIKVYSHIDNSYNDGVGWDTTTVHEVKI